MIIKIHRWQPKSGRYRTMQHDLSEGRPVLDLLANNNGLRLTPDMATEQMVLRTQRVDRILIDTTADVVEVFMSPIVDRTYKRELNRTGAKKASMADVVCSCKHTQGQHAGGERICLIPGCICKGFDRAGTRREVVERAMPTPKNDGDFIGCRHFERSHVCNCYCEGCANGEHCGVWV